MLDGGNGRRRQHNERQPYDAQIQAVVVPKDGGVDRRMPATCWALSSGATMSVLTAASSTTPGSEPTMAR